MSFFCDVLAVALHNRQVRYPYVEIGPTRGGPLLPVSPRCSWAVSGISDGPGCLAGVVRSLSLCSWPPRVGRGAEASWPALAKGDVSRVQGEGPVCHLHLSGDHPLLKALLCLSS